VRTFLGWLLLVAILGTIAFASAPLVAQPLIAQGVRAALPFGADPLEVDVSVDTPHLLTGSIDAIHITGSHLETAGASIGSLDVTADDVSIADRGFASITGTLGAVVLHRPSGIGLPIDRITLSGASTAVHADALLGKETVVALVQAALADSGLAADAIELTNGGLRLTVLGQRTEVAVGVVDGAVTLGGAGSIASGSIVVFRPQPGDAWRITGVSTSPSGMDVHAVLDLNGLLAGGG
jgi:hypothetical protein